MAKFDYKKWITENKHGKLDEQTGTMCYACQTPDGTGIYGVFPDPISAASVNVGTIISAPLSTLQQQSGYLAAGGAITNGSYIGDPNFSGHSSGCGLGSATGYFYDQNFVTEFCPSVGSGTTTTPTGSATGSGAVTGSATGSGAVTGSGCYACHPYVFANGGDPLNYPGTNPGELVLIPNTADLGYSNGYCGMANNLFTDPQGILATGITTGFSPLYSLGSPGYDYLLNVACPASASLITSIGGPTSAGTGSFDDYGIGGGTQFNYPGNWSVTGWTNNFVDMMLNHPNPCNFLNQRYNQFGNQLQQGGMGPLQTNLVYQKFAVVHTLLELTGCGLPSPNPFTSLLQEQINEINLDPAAAELLAKREKEIKGLSRKKGTGKGKERKRRRTRRRRNESQISNLKRIIKETLSELQEQDFMANIKPSFNPMNPGSGGQVSYNCAKNNTCQPVQGLGGDFMSLAECEASGCGPNPEDFGGGVGHPSGLGHSKRKFSSSNRFRNR